jgi:hypothetical protein
MFDRLLLKFQNIGKIVYGKLGYHSKQQGKLSWSHMMLGYKGKGFILLTIYFGTHLKINQTCHGTRVNRYVKKRTIWHKSLERIFGKGKSEMFQR